MNYVEHLNLFGVEAKEIPCIKGKGAPTEATEGEVGCLYMNTNNGDLYKCVAANTWELVSVAGGEGGSITVEHSFDSNSINPISGKGLGTVIETVNTNNLLNQDTMTVGEYYAVSVGNIPQNKTSGMYGRGLIDVVGLSNITLYLNTISTVYTLFNSFFVGLDGKVISCNTTSTTFDINNPQTFDVPTGAVSFGFSVYRYNTIGENKIMINAGTEALPYESYGFKGYSIPKLVLSANAETIGGKNVRDDYPVQTGYVNMNGAFVNSTASRYVRIPVAEGETWAIWYPNETHYNSSSTGALRLEDTAGALVRAVNLAFQPKIKMLKDSEVLGVTIVIPSGVSSMCVNLTVGTVFDYTSVAIITKGIYGTEYVTEIGEKWLFSEIAHNNSTYNTKWVAFGDSITERNTTATKNWVMHVSEKLSMPCANLGSSGKGYKRSGGFSQFFDKIPAEVELVSFYGSFNDMGDSSYVIGNASDTYEEGADNSLAAHMNYCYDYIQNNFPLAKIAVIAPAPWATINPADTSSNASQYVSVMQEICRLRGIPFLDLFHCSNLRPWQTEQNAAYFSNADGCHPNDGGHRIIANKIIEFLRSV